MADLRDTLTPYASHAGTIFTHPRRGEWVVIHQNRMGEWRVQRWLGQDEAERKVDELQSRGYRTAYCEEM